MSETKEKEVNSVFSGIVKAVDLAHYQEGSIVSRTLINKRAGTVTFFAFDREQSLSEHSAPYDALVWVLDGQADVRISAKTSRLKQGEMILIPANKPHALKAVEKFKMLLVMIKG